MTTSSTQALIQSLLQHKKSINQASETAKNEALAKMATSLQAAQAEILAANQIDMENAHGHIAPVMLDRLKLTPERIAEMAQGILALQALPDPVGRILASHQAENGMHIQKVAIPFGLLGMIYESRPNVTSDVAALAVKSGNAVILRGGKEAYNSAAAIVKALKAGLAQSEISPQVIELVSDTSRASSLELMTAKGQIDLLIPRGGAGLIKAVVENATVPVIETGTGICHVYVDQAADLDQALKIVANAKTSRPSVCNSAEVCLVHEKIAATFLPCLNELFKGQVQMRADQQALPYLPDAIAADSQDFDTEFLDYIMAIKVVPDTQAAIDHINQHSTGHSEAIVTKDDRQAQLFTQAVDSAAVYVNASTRFTDGGQFGLGCELGISTQKMHARGPMGLAEMTTYKYIIQGDGQIRA